MCGDDPMFDTRGMFIYTDSIRGCDCLGMGQAKIEGVASNRRVVHENGAVSFGRGSRSGGSEFLANAPDGLIDPMLKTISFWNGDKPLAALHSYATHPMSYYGGGGVTSDFVGLARERRRRTPCTRSGPETPSPREDRPPLGDR